MGGGVVFGPLRQRAGAFMFPCIIAGSAPSKLGSWFSILSSGGSCGSSGLDCIRYHRFCSSTFGKVRRAALKRPFTSWLGSFGVFGLYSSRVVVVQSVWRRQEPAESGLNQSWLYRAMPRNSKKLREQEAPSPSHHRTPDVDPKPLDP